MVIIMVEYKRPEFIEPLTLDDAFLDYNVSGVFYAVKPYSLGRSYEIMNGDTEPMLDYYEDNSLVWSKTYNECNELEKALYNHLYEIIKREYKRLENCYCVTIRALNEEGDTERSDFYIATDGISEAITEVIELYTTIDIENNTYMEIINVNAEPIAYADIPSGHIVL